MLRSFAVGDTCSAAAKRAPRPGLWRRSAPAGEKRRCISPDKAEDPAAVQQVYGLFSSSAASGDCIAAPPSSGSLAQLYSGEWTAEVTRALFPYLTDATAQAWNNGIELHGDYIISGPAIIRKQVRQREMKLC